MPKITAVSDVKKRVPEKSKVLTSTPVKLEIETMLKKRKPNKPSCQAKKRKIRSKESVKKKVSNSVQGAVKRKLVLDVPAHKSTDENEYECIYCGDAIVNAPPEPWVQCSVCLNWCHEACVLHMKPPLPANFACCNCLPKRKRRNFVTAYFISFASDVQ